MAKRYLDAGERNYFPNDETFDAIPAIIDCLVAGCVPDKPLIDKTHCIVAFGSCFADHVSNYLKAAGYNVTTRDNKNLAYIASMGDGIVNTFAVLQQFEWAWLDKKPSVDLWYGYDSRAMGYLDEVRVETKRLLDQTDVFILTLGLSEIWYDEPSGEVFWRVMPSRFYDPTRHKFRTAKQSENLNNLRAIIALIRQRRPQALIVFTLSPIPLKLTYRDQSCIVANEASKANLRSALDELMFESEDNSLFYFPSYELVRCFNNPYVRDRRHLHDHVVNFVMSAFDHYFCGGMTYDELLRRFFTARQQDKAIEIDDTMLLTENKGRLERKFILVQKQGKLKKLSWRADV